MLKKYITRLFWLILFFLAHFIFIQDVYSGKFKNRKVEKRFSYILKIFIDFSSFFDIKIIFP